MNQHMPESLEILAEDIFRNTNRCLMINVLSGGTVWEVLWHMKY